MVAVRDGCVHGATDDAELMTPRPFHFPRLITSTSSLPTLSPLPTHPAPPPSPPWPPRLKTRPRYTTSGHTAPSCPSHSASSSPSASSSLASSAHHSTSSASGDDGTYTRATITGNTTEKLNPQQAAVQKQNAVQMQGVKVEDGRSGGVPAGDGGGVVQGASITRPVDGAGNSPVNAFVTFCDGASVSMLL